MKFYSLRWDVGHTCTPPLLQGTTSATHPVLSYNILHKKEDLMILCEFSKMAIYEAGGHFDVHRDTVRSHAHQATMLVEVRSAHIGGDLILEPTNGESVRWSLSSIPSDLGNDFVRYIAFYTDVNHRVEPVESGVRIALQYDIYVDDDGEDNWNIFHPDKNDFFRNTIPFSSSISTDYLLTLLDEYVTDRLSVSFPLLHLYTDTKLLPSRLKSTDHQIFTALLDHGFHVQMIPVQITATSDLDGSFAEDYVQYEIQSLDVSDDGSSLDENGTIIHSKQTLSKVLYIATGFERLVVIDETDYIAHTGNESAPAEYRYFQSVFVVSRKQPDDKKGKRKIGL
jgi:hypothetical protein